MDSKFVPVGWAVLRTPLLPLTTWFTLVGDARASDDLRRGLDNLLQAPEVQEALYLASPSLFNAMKVWRNDPFSRKGKTAELGLMAFISRVCSRATPFGLSAGINLVSTGDRTVLQLAHLSLHRRRTQIDRRWLRDFCRRFTLNPNVQPNLRYVLNDTATWHDGRVTFYKASYAWDSSRTSYSTVTLVVNAALTALRETLKSGCTRAYLQRSLEACSTDPAAVDGYITELISLDFLCPTLTPILSGASATNQLLCQLREVPDSESCVEALENAMRTAGRGDTHSLGDIAPVAFYGEIAKQLAAASPATSAEIPLVHVDLIKVPSLAFISQALLTRLAASAELVLRLSQIHDDDLTQFCARFTERFAGQSVPLLLALDEEQGVPFSPRERVPKYLRGLGIGGNVLASKPLTLAERHCLGLISTAIATGTSSVELDLKLFPAHAKSQSALILSVFTLLATVVRCGEDENDWKIFIGGISPSFGLLGRFAGVDPQLHDLVREVLRADQKDDEDSIHADLIHSPGEGQLGNIICGPPLEEKAVVLKGATDRPADSIIDLDDLDLSVEQGEPVLRSKRHKKKVLPRLPHSHTFSLPGNLPLYQFLARLQYPKYSMPWTVAISLFPHVPRITCGNTILSLATWSLTSQEAVAVSAALDETSMMSAVEHWRAIWRLPCQVALVNGEQSIPIDLRQPICIRLIVRAIRRDSGARLTELLVDLSGLCVQGAEGLYSHELIVPLRRRLIGSTKSSERGQHMSQAERMRSPFCHWLYLKLFVGEMLAENVLKEIAPVLSRAIAEGYCSEWYFIRYKDPEPHLRVRLRLSTSAGREPLIAMLSDSFQRFLNENIISRVVFDTYIRETGRYGGAEGMEWAERLFCAESQAVVLVLPLPEDEVERLALATEMVEALMIDLGLTLHERHQLFKNMSETLRAEFSLTPDGCRLFGRQLKELQATIETFKPDCDLIRDQLISKRRNGYSAWIGQSEIYWRRTDTGADFLSVCASLCHMCTNRMFPFAQRIQETIVQELLRRRTATACALQEEIKGMKNV